MNRLLKLQSHFVRNQTFLDQKNRSTINKNEFLLTIYGVNFQARQTAFKHIKQNLDKFQHYHLTQASRSHQRQITTKQLLITMKIFQIEKNTKLNPNRITLITNGMAFYDLNIIIKAGAHYSLYLKAIQRLGTEKHKKIYQDACKCRDMGCFGLTEFMHGSNVKGLLTEAHYDHSTREIIIHTPSQDAMKYWIGGSGKTSDMCVVWAQLYIKQKCYGVHAFVVPLRCKKTHKTLPGITIGDCGPKFGINGIDNGFIIFNHFRIPVNNLLDKVSGINQNGQFFSTVKQNKRFGMTLTALSEGRLFMSMLSTTHGLTALTIALRFAFTYRQPGQKNKVQPLLIQSPIIKARIIPLLAVQIIYMCVTMKAFYQSQTHAQKNNFTQINPVLDEIHAISSVLKPKNSWNASLAIRECRQIMGLHGLSSFSKMQPLYTSCDAHITWEGQNSVLIQQTTKYVLDNYQLLMKGKQIKSSLLKFLADPPNQEFLITRQSILDLENIKKHLQKKIASKIQQLVTGMMQLREQKLKSGQIWNASQVYMGQNLSLDTGDLYILNSSIEKMNNIKDPKTKDVFQNILQIWALNVLRNDESFSQKSHGLIEKVMLELCEKLTPQILGLLQTISTDDEIIGSPFADQEGDGYETYMNSVLTPPRRHHYLSKKNTQK